MCKMWRFFACKEVVRYLCGNFHGYFMDDWLLGGALGILIMIILGVLLRLELCHKSLIFHLTNAHNEIKHSITSNEVELPPNLIEEVKTELTDSVHDIMGSMKVPTAIDHLAGVFANVMQMREQWKIQKEANELGSLISTNTPAEDYGTPQEPQI